MMNRDRAAQLSYLWWTQAVCQYYYSEKPVGQLIYMYTVVWSRSVVSALTLHLFLPLPESFPSLSLSPRVSIWCLCCWIKAQLFMKTMPPTFLLWTVTQWSAPPKSSPTANPGLLILFSHNNILLFSFLHSQSASLHNPPLWLHILGVFPYCIKQSII